MHDSRAEKQRAYRERVEAERWKLADELDKLRRRLDAQGDHEAAELLGRVESALHHGRPRKSDPVRAGRSATTRSSRAGEVVTLREAVTVAATTTKPSARKSPPPTAGPEPLRVLVLSDVRPKLPNHLNLWDDMQAGATLREIGPEVWQLTRPSGETRQVDKRTVSALLRYGTLKEA